MRQTPKKVLLAIVDGMGISERKEGNAVYLAKTPTLDLLMSGEYPFAKIGASGLSVGLPVGQIGNSEVGHLNIGTGRIVYTGLSRINNSIETGEFEKLPELLETIEHAKKNNGKVHILGLLSPGGVHSHQNQIFALIKVINQAGLTPIIHVFGDGRDVPPKSIKIYLNELIAVAKDNNAIISTISGRFYAMDRDKRWDRVELAYQNIIGNSANEFKDILEYVDSQYAKEIFDEFIEPAHSPDHEFIKANDTVIFANFRPDRARELSHLIYGSTYYDYESKKIPGIFLTIAMKYEGIKPNVILFPPEVITGTMGEAIEKAGLSQLRIAETEKYAHVTFFFDGGSEVEFKNSKRILVPSPKVKTYDLAPKMSANELTTKLIAEIKNYDVIILNFANPDMVGHTGDLEKTIESVEFIDAMLKQLWTAMDACDGTMFITADHGNADVMLDLDGNIVTAHSTSEVPFISTDKSITFTTKMGILANIAPSILEYIGITIPKEMTSKSIIEKKEK